MSRTLDVSSVITLPLLGQSVDFHIKKIIGVGGSCIAYEVVYSESNSITHKCILKEFCPVYLDNGTSPVRDGQRILVPDEYREKYNEDLDRFKRMYRDINFYLADNPSATNYHPILLGICEENNTVYTLTSYDYGKSYDKIEDTDLHTVLKLMLTVTKAVEQYHNANFLHLDIKPKNILVLDGVADIVKLFDYDSLTPMAAFKSRRKILVPSPEDYYVPELATCNVSAIGVHTDIFEIAAMLFLRLFGRAPTHAELRHDTGFSLDECKLVQGASPVVKFELTKLFENTLQISKWNRYSTTAELKEHLKLLIDLTSPGNEIYLMDLPKWQPSALSVGRRDSLKELDSILDKHGYVFIHSIGGLGKSELAKMYAREYSAKYHTVQFCKYSSSLLELVAVLPVKGINDDNYKNLKNLAREKLNVLHASDGQTLLIIDNFNVTHDEYLRDFLPVNNRSFKVIFTTRCIPAVNYLADKVLSLSKLSHDECRQLFHLHAGLSEESTDASLDKLINLVDRNTLILILIASTVKQSGISVSEMLNKLETNTLDEVQTKIFHDYDVTTEETKSYNKIYSHLTTIFNVSSLSSEECEILKCMSLIPMEGIELDSFVSYCDDPGVTHDALRKLINSGWIQYYNETEITIHPLISDILSDNDDLPIGLCYYNLTDRLEQFCITDLMDHITLIRQKLSYALHLNKRFVSEPYGRRILNITTIGRAYSNLCNLKNAKKYLLDAAEMERQSRSHTYTPQIYYLLGEAEQFLGSAKEAIKYYEMAIREAKRLSNRDYDTVLDSMIKIANCYSDNHNQEKAYSIMLKAYRYAKFHSFSDELYDICEGIVTLCTDLDMENKAHKYRLAMERYASNNIDEDKDQNEDDDAKLINALSVGDFDTALAQWEEQCANNKRIFGEDSPVYKKIFNKYRWMYYLMAGDINEAQRLVTDHLSFIEATFGTQSMEMAEFLSLLSTVYLNYTDDINYSIQSAQKAVDICIAINELESYTYFEANLNLANCYINQLRIFDAKSIVDKLDATMFNGSEAVYDFSTTYAMILVELSEYDKAEHQCKLILQKQTLTQLEHSQAKYILSICYEQRGELEIAHKYIDSALDYIKTLKESSLKDQWLFKVYRVKAKLYYRKGNYKQAIDILSECHEKLKTISTLKFILLLERGLYYECMRDYDSSMRDFNEAEQILIANDMPDDSYITLYNNMATAYIDQQNYEMGKLFLERIVKIRPQLLEATTSLGVHICHNLGFTALGLNDLETADLYIKKAVRANEAMQTNNYIENCTFKYVLSMLYEAQGEYELCIETLQYLLDTYVPEYDPSADSLIKYHMLLIKAVLKSGKTEEINTYIEGYDAVYHERFGKTSEKRAIFLSLAAVSTIEYNIPSTYHYLNEAVKLTEASTLNNTPFHAGILNYLGVYYTDHALQYSSALDCFLRSKVIYEKSGKRNTSEYDTVINNINYVNLLIQ